MAVLDIGTFFSTRNIIYNATSVYRVQWLEITKPVFDENDQLPISHDTFKATNENAQGKADIKKIVVFNTNIEPTIILNIFYVALTRRTLHVPSKLGLKNYQTHFMIDEKL